MASQFPNQNDPENEGTALFLLAEGLVFMLSLLRIFVVSIVLAVNVIALRRCSALGQPAVKCSCLHLYISDSVKICSIIYITSWIPFLFYSLFNGRWLWIDEQIFCLIQTYITNAILLVLLAMAALTAWNRTRTQNPVRPLLSAGLTLAGWILPQMANFIILTTSQVKSVTEAGPSNDARLDFDFLDDLLGSTDRSSSSSGITYKIGFTICGQGLCRQAVTQYLLQYVIIIMPISLVCTAIVIRHLLRQCHRYAALKNDRTTTSDSAEVPECNCSTAGESPALEIILGTTVVWLAVVRPCVLLLWSQDHLFVDLGSHLMLTVAAVFAPILPSQLVVRQVKIYQLETQDVARIEPTKSTSS